MLSFHCGAGAERRMVVTPAEGKRLPLALITTIPHTHRLLCGYKVSFFTAERLLLTTAISQERKPSLREAATLSQTARGMAGARTDLCTFRVLQAHVLERRELAERSRRVWEQGRGRGDECGSSRVCRQRAPPPRKSAGPRPLPGPAPLQRGTTAPSEERLGGLGFEALGMGGRWTGWAGAGGAAAGDGLGQSRRRSLKGGHRRAGVCVDPSKAQPRGPPLRSHPNRGGGTPRRELASVAQPTASRPRDGRGWRGRAAPGGLHPSSTASPQPLQSSPGLEGQPAAS
nr:uncharacterized protein LOC112425276 [Macaca nemestrina]